MSRVEVVPFRTEGILDKVQLVLFVCRACRAEWWDRSLLGQAYDWAECPKCLKFKGQEEHA